MAKKPNMYMKFLKGKRTLSERDTKLISRRLNAGKITQDEVFKDYGKRYRIDQAHTRKGYRWLMDLWKTPRGLERKNNPFGYREEDILENFSHFEMGEYYDAANYYQSQSGMHFYIPLWDVVAKDGNSFQYYFWGGEMSIVG